MPKEVTFTKSIPVAKVHRGLGIVFGWAIACTVNGEPYIDLQKHHIPDEEMLSGSAVFMETLRTGGEMHRKDPETKEVVKRGTVIFAFPLTTEIAKAMGVQSRITGLMVGWKPDEDCREEILSKVESGEYAAFSIGGKLFSTKPMTEEAA
jgi:hypothetical protein